MALFAEEPASPLRVVAIVGTDHHPFDRMMTWVNHWLAAHPDQIATFFAQTGTASVKAVCPSASYLDTEQLKALLDAADLVICHGGPATIAEAWARGQVPIVVPRMSRLGEHVDDHQVDFCTKFEQLGRIRVARTGPSLDELLDVAAHDLVPFRTSATDDELEASVARFAALVDELVSRPRRRLMLNRSRQTADSRRVQSDTAERDDYLSSNILPFGGIKGRATAVQSQAGKSHVGTSGVHRKEQA
jgi:UDP-N-acetylglucosamine transferase subunit ALG13